MKITRAGKEFNLNVNQLFDGNAYSDIYAALVVARDGKNPKECKHGGYTFKKLGAGVFRTVYAVFFSGIDTNIVVKVAKNKTKTRSNCYEYANYLTACEHGFEYLLAPVLALVERGVALFMEKASSIVTRGQMTHTELKKELGFYVEPRKVHKKHYNPKCNTVLDIHYGNVVGGLIIDYGQPLKMVY